MTTEAPAGTSRWWLMLTLVLVGIAVALAPVTARAIARRRRWAAATTDRAAVEAAWRDVLDATVDVEIPTTKFSTPRDVASKLPKRCRLSAQAAGELAGLAELVERLRYSDHAVEVPPAGELHRTAAAIRTEIYDSLAPRDRRQVAVWPASGRQAVADVWNRVGEGASSIAQRGSSAVTGRIRGRLRGAAPSAPRSGS